VTFVMGGLDVRDKLIVLVGGGDVTARSAERFLTEGAVLRIIAPRLTDAAAELLHVTDRERMSWVPRPFRDTDVDDAWLVHTATGVSDVDTAVDTACRSRRIWCIDAADALRGTARLSAEARHDDLVVGTLSTGSPDPRRSASVRSAVQKLFERGLLPDRKIRNRQECSDEQHTGSVTLIGGGPGPGDLMTLRGYRALTQADVIVHDRLGPTDVLGDLGRHVEVIDVGKSPGNHPVSQQRINDILVGRARRGLRVARLKGGDPFVLGRGGEEAQACNAAGVPVEVIPGVSSVVAAPQVAGIPVTHRGTADSVHVVNGHRHPRPSTLAALHDDGTTVVVLMGTSTLPDFVAASLDAGVPSKRPVTIVENAHRPGQRCLNTTLGYVTELATSQSVKNPAVIVVGEAARPGLLTGQDDTDDTIVQGYLGPLAKGVSA
jgi:uroporphyrin-III C-methyltransferase/precorrin-2 dehydrogenase/sirohydrochlorin ferrochelatase